MGVTTNRALLTSVLADEEFRRGGVATDFLEPAPRADCDSASPAADDADVVLAARVVCDAANRRQRAVGG